MRGWSMSRATARGQMSLSLNAERTKDLDTKQRSVVIAVLARLLLEAAGAVARTEGVDDPS